ncbi:MAG: Hpt domain-containing protein [Lachnospiraceae bacterium]|jgi:HPt (histidine-containing phosphotransfer) domain-containing protein|nr:Hpt domain-containing protein [Lachnospiraceae bacterium]MCI9281718.1 Hpt domain-containing protein [Lachnospiraceae bacterium]
MTLKECYTALEGDYEGVLNRLRSEKMVQKFVLKFLNDKSHELLVTSMEAGNYEEAFRAAHTIKGVCQNLSFTKLYESSHLLTENLRAGYGADTDELVQRVEADYHQTMAAIEELQTGNPA